jgi:hypothetical protein
MKTFVTAALLGIPIMAFGAGWNYYVLNDQGQWEQISPYELDLSMSATGESGEAARGTLTRDNRHVLIFYGKPDQRERRPKHSGIRQVGSDLVEEVE